MSIKPPLSSATRIRSIAGGALGNLVEWYDWYVYSAFALYFSAAFFPAVDQTAQLLQSAGIFALGFIMRPLGGWLFGVVGDRYGRKQAMTTSVLLMSFGSVLIAIIPTYQQIGVLAPISLLTARLIQGLSVGGEYGISATYLSEMATPERRGFFSSFQYVTLVGGQVLALAVQLILQYFLLTEEQLHHWGWRIPFAIGAILSIVVLYIRSRLHETEAFNELKEKHATLRHPVVELWRHPKSVLLVVGLTMGGTLAFYTYTTYMQKFLVNSAGVSKQLSTVLTFIALLVFAGLQPTFGALSDRIGRKPLLIGFGIAGTIATIPIFSLLSSTTSIVVILALMIAALMIVSGYTSINAVVKAELFPTNIRTLGVGLPYALTVAIFGGSAEYIALSFKQAGHEAYFYYYITGTIAISLLVYIFMRDTKQDSAMDHPEQ
ncbi:MFS transporter [Pseudochryseolinea flava]|uniref:Alpha-ketoglutarate transporter n=1 Tax=Pseudochryseolinea flava TaxID=2059302 RepID=A0A364Y0P0_9BACT|nr:MFS transporter [Pseudochryseolinea flava]RAW00372.1 alpha-ketoglutarate transporter [Pseudochryseolinea flava]